MNSFEGTDCKKEKRNEGSWRDFKKTFLVPGHSQ